MPIPLLTAPRRRPLAAAASAAVVAVLALAGVGEAAEPAPAAAAAQGENPCLGPQSFDLLCPDLVMAAPFDVKIDNRTRPRRTLLRAANSIDNLGLGPAELRGRRTSARFMYASQRIVRRDGSRLRVVTNARLYFKFIPEQGRYWKFHNAARFELWRLDDFDERLWLERVGPKAVYCLRDLKRTHPSSQSPRRMVYPGCNRSARTRYVTLGTSVGWSDVYPAKYHEQWIDVTGLSGRFTFVHIADPRNGIWEQDETNNAGETIVNLPSGRVEAHRDGGSPYWELGPADGHSGYDY